MDEVTRDPATACLKEASPALATYTAGGALREVRWRIGSLYIHLPGGRFYAGPRVAASKAVAMTLAEFGDHDEFCLVQDPKVDAWIKKAGGGSEGVPAKGA